MLDCVLRYLQEELGPQQGLRGLGLAHAHALFGALGNPQDGFRAVHVAGTAGKGSVSTFVTSLLRAHGFRVGTHLSPHVYSVLERFQVDGGPAAPELIEAELTRIRSAVDAVERAGYGQPSFFEVTNAIALRLFAGRVDYGVVETGVGGLLDSTNTMSRPDKLAVITAIGLDHQDLLGTTIAEIAHQKAGILPLGGRAVAARQSSSAVDDVLRAEAARRRCTLRLVGLERCSMSATSGSGGTALRLPRRLELPLGLTGRHQADNAYLALRAVSALAARDGWSLDARAIRDGLRSATLPGRFQRRVLGRREVILDGAHNAMKLEALVRTLREMHPGSRMPWVLAFKRDKDLGAALRVVAPVASVEVATAFSTGGGDHPPDVSLAAERIADGAAECGVGSVVEEDPARSVARAAEMTEPGLPVVVTGSFHLLAAARAGTTAR